MILLARKPEKNPRKKSPKQQNENRNRDRRAPAESRAEHPTKQGLPVFISPRPRPLCGLRLVLSLLPPPPSPSSAKPLRPRAAPRRRACPANSRPPHTGGRHRDDDTAPPASAPPDEIAPRRAMQTPPPAVSGDPPVFSIREPAAVPRVFYLCSVSSSLSRGVAASLECVSSCRAASWKGGGRPYECSVLSCAWNAPRALTGALASTTQCSSCGHAEAGAGWRRRGRSRRSNNSVRCYCPAVVYALALWYSVCCLL